MTIFEAIAKVTGEKPFIQSRTQARVDIKLKPINGVDRCEVYYAGELINKNYKIKQHQFKELWDVVA